MIYDKFDLKHGEYQGECAHAKSFIETFGSVFKCVFVSAFYDQNEK